MSGRSEKSGARALRRYRLTKPGEAGRGPGGADARRSRAERGKEGGAGGEKGKEAEVPGGRGARAGSKEGRRGWGLRKNAPTSCPARARKREPGHRARDRRARPRAPRRSPPRADTRYTVPGPARPPSPRLLGEVGRRREGAGRCWPWRGLLPARLSQQPPIPGPQFFHLSKGTKRGEVILAEGPGGEMRAASPGSKLPNRLAEDG